LPLFHFFWHSIWHILWQDSDISSDFWLLTFYPIWHFITLFYHHRLIDLNHNISLHWQNLTSILTLTVWGWHSNSILFDWHSILSSYQIIFWHSLLVFFVLVFSLFEPWLSPQRPAGKKEKEEKEEKETGQLTSNQTTLPHLTGGELFSISLN